MESNMLSHFMDEELNSVLRTECFELCMHEFDVGV